MAKYSSIKGWLHSVRDKCNHMGKLTQLINSMTELEIWYSVNIKIQQIRENIRK